MNCGAQFLNFHTIHSSFCCSDWPIISDNLVGDRIPTYDFFLDGTSHHLLGYIRIRNCLKPLGKIVNWNQDESMIRESYLFPTWRIYIWWIDSQSFQTYLFPKWRMAMVLLRRLMDSEVRESCWHKSLNYGKSRHTGSNHFPWLSNNSTPL